MAIRKNTRGAATGTRAEKDRRFLSPAHTGPVLKDIDHAALLQTRQELCDILLEMVEMESSFEDGFQHIHPTYMDSAKNLLHYMAMRQKDVRGMQDRLARFGLSSLGRAESHTMTSVNAVLNIIDFISGNYEGVRERPKPPVDYDQGKFLLKKHTIDLLGDSPLKRDTYIMVTMPSEAAEDYRLVKEMLANGMECMRINCSHDDRNAWARMITHLRRAEKDLNKKCKIFMDLAGHKLRTGPMEKTPALLKIGPVRDGDGKAEDFARIWLTPAENQIPPTSSVDAIVPVMGKWLAGLERGAMIEFTDARGKPRTMEVAAAVGDCRVAILKKKAWIKNGIVLRYEDSESEVAGLQADESYIVLTKEDTLILARDCSQGKPAEYDEKGRVLKPAIIGVTLPEVFTGVKAGERIWFDDGKIGGIIRFVNEGQIHVEITQARFGGEKLRAQKGINLPDSDLKLASLTEKDIEDLGFIAANADAVGFSFVGCAEDVHQLQSRLALLGGEHTGIVLKIETIRSFDRLPELLLAAMRSPCAGVMIARGDLAVECGYERMAEVQEEILWFCEAAQMPVIWATQVLEKLAKKGMPSRAEITDAAMSGRAECVMLNKGPYIVDALRILDDILKRMRSHQMKKSSMLRKLSLVHKFRA